MSETSAHSQCPYCQTPKGLNVLFCENCEYPYGDFLDEKNVYIKKRNKEIEVFVSLSRSIKIVSSFFYILGILCLFLGIVSTILTAGWLFPLLILAIIIGLPYLGLAYWIVKTNSPVFPLTIGAVYFILPGIDYFYLSSLIIATVVGFKTIIVIILTFKFENVHKFNDMKTILFMNPMIKAKILEELK